jgi:hypothetical protein
VTASGAVLVGIPDDPGYGPLKRFAAEAADVEQLHGIELNRWAYELVNAWSG